MDPIKTGPGAARGGGGGVVSDDNIFDKMYQLKCKIMLILNDEIFVLDFIKCPLVTNRG